jgi:hypothetical protein
MDERAMDVHGPSLDRIRKRAALAAWNEAVRVQRLPWGDDPDSERYGAAVRAWLAAAVVAGLGYLSPPASVGGGR